MYPKFKIQKIKEEDGSIIVSGTLDRTSQGKEKWIDDGWVGSLMKESTVAFGRWFKKADDIWEFRFDEEEKNKLELKPNELIEVLDGYWGERAEITLDKSIQWKESEFKTEGNWDHEHCAICWEKIAEYENQTFYLGNNRHPVCVSCYKRHIQVHDLSFIPNA